MADILAWVVLFIAPVIGITVFWLVHILPEKIAEKRHHPQAMRSRRCVCCRWSSAACCGRSPGCGRTRRPVLYKMAYGADTVKHGTMSPRLKRQRPHRSLRRAKRNLRARQSTEPRVTRTSQARKPWEG